MSTGKIFISYRRADAAGYARSIFDRLNAQFPGRVLIDLRIPPGVNFVEWIESRVNSCRVFLELIGDDWATITDKSGKRRLDDPDDHVRSEIVSALHRAAIKKQDLEIIPILVEGAVMPASSTLPDDIAAISFHNALILTEVNFDDDIERLIVRLNEILPPKPVSWRRITLAIGSVLSGLVLIGFMAMLLNSYLGRSDAHRYAGSATANAGPISPPTVDRDQKGGGPPGTVLFTNSNVNLNGKLADAYVGFSFYYPNAWRTDPTAGVPGARNFVKVERRLPWDMTQESFAVGHYEYDHDRPEQRTEEVMKLNSAIAGQIPEYRKVSEGWTEIGINKGYEFRFEGMSRNTQQGDIRIWGRTILLPPPDEGKKGVTLLIMGTSLAPELKSVSDVGVKGEALIILKTFRFETP